MFLPLSLAVPPMASMVSEEMERRRDDNRPAIRASAARGRNRTARCRLFSASRYGLRSCAGKTPAARPASSPELSTSPLPMRTWKMDDPPEIVDGNRHERHDFLFAAPGEAREETADGLDAVLRIAAMRITTSLMDETFCAPPDDVPAVALLIIEGGISGDYFNM